MKFQMSDPWIVVNEGMHDANPNTWQEDLRTLLVIGLCIALFYGTVGAIEIVDGWIKNARKKRSKKKDAD